MKYSAALSLALTGSAMAAGAADTVNQVLSDIGTSLKSFDSAITSYTGGDSKALFDASSKIQSVTEGGASQIAAGSDLTLSDALSITTAVQGLQKTLDGTLKDLEGIGSKLAAAGACGTITSSLEAQQGAASKLQDAITSKAPAETKPVAQQLGGKVGASIANTQSKFKEICAGAPSGGSSSGGSSSGSSSSGHSDSGHSSMAGAAPTPKPAKTGKPAASSTAPKPATFTGGASRLSVGGALAMGAAVLAL